MNKEALKEIDAAIQAGIKQVDYVTAQLAKAVPTLRVFTSEAVVKQLKAAKDLLKIVGGFAVETELANNQWDDCWVTDGRPQRFASVEAACDEIRTHVQDMLVAVEDGHLEDAMECSEFRIRNLTTDEVWVLDNAGRARPAGDKAA